MKPNLCLFAAFLMLIGCAPKDIEKMVRTAVPDSAKADMVLSEFSQEKALMASLKEEQFTYINEVKKLNADYNTADAQFEIFFSSLNVRNAAIQQDFLTRHMNVRSRLTEDEWKKINKAIQSASVKNFEEVLK